MMNQIGRLKWYFTHASVGEEMMIGITSLNTSNPAFYPLHEIPASDATVDQAEAGAIYDYDRGNPGWWPKLAIFEDCVNNGWRYPLVNIAMNKYCFIDANADLETTIDVQSGLEAAYPETLFVYMTMPLTTHTGAENYPRNLYNDGLREWCWTNNRVLLDIADIESHDTNGEACTYVYNGYIGQRLWDGYNGSGDHDHPDSPLGQQTLAKGLYALSAALMTVDRDSDGVSDGHELIAGTRPLDPESVLKLRGGTDPGSGRVVLEWKSVSNRFYTIQRAVVLHGYTKSVSVAVDTPGTPPVNTFTDAPPAIGIFYYRLSVRQ
jgi:hypothetical protein